ncbi:hypothetical protein B0H17DRAFT_556149 [Mycena rosella]|uniref:Uncharacterized protein n=1 Tax=Mycena rosella TaxID=1033263 RepID=A0AAD7BRK0_MYCRO|nr:hypothetical protein B0H17DRAFT_556149 [Mycena rosella]
MLHFEYPLTKPFPRGWRYFLLAFALVSAAAFIAINVFLVGYDVVSITTTDSNFNSTKGAILPWTSDANLGCQPHQFQLGDTFRTNVSVFSYSIFDVVPSTLDTEASAIQGGFFYANNDLSSCDVVQYEIVIKPGDRLVTSTATIQCPSPLNFQAITSWSYSNHVMIGGLSAAMFPENSLARAITDGMNNISSEAYWDIYNGAYTTNITNGQTGLPQKIYKVVADGQPSCDTSPPFFCVIPTFTSYNAIGNTDLNIVGFTDILANLSSLYNVINVLYAAVRLDLGHWTADNLFTNTTSFNNLIAPSDIPANTVSTNNSLAFRSFASSKGMAYVNFTTPPSASTRTGAAVIQIPYTCNVMRRKSTGSFIVSVLSATISMFLAAWGAVGAILSAIARRRPAGNACGPATLEGHIIEDEHQAKATPLLHRSLNSY